MIKHIFKTDNTHERDKNLVFDEEPHKYYINDNKTNDYTSVTTWIHSHFEPFNANIIIDKMMQSKKWEKSEYFGMTKEEIKTQWKENGRKAAEDGTNMHQHIEDFYNNKEVNDDTKEFGFFMKFHSDLEDLEPYRTEWMVYDEELKIAGSIDMLYKNKNGNLDIYDWKRCKNIKKENPWQNSITKCIKHIPDTNFWHYSLQLNIYKNILERNYDVKVDDLYIVCMHPNQETYIKMKIPNLQQELDSLFKERIEILELDNLENDIEVFMFI